MDIKETMSKEKRKAIMKIRSTLLQAIDQYFKNCKFNKISPPILTSFSSEVACVGGSDLISVNFYDKKMFLSQSGQLYLESLAIDLNQVYCISPTFRAESTTLLCHHLSEFWMCEAEAVELNIGGAIELAHDLIKEIVKQVLHYNKNELKLLNPKIAELKKLIVNKFPIIRYEEAIKQLKQNNIKINYGDDLSSKQEAMLTKLYGELPLTITHFPKELSSFYKMEDPNNSRETLSFDIVGPNGFRELVGGSQREANYQKLKQALERANADVSQYEWHLNTIKKNPKVHSGFGLGIERILSWICNIRDLKQTIPFPRTEYLVTP